MGSGRGRESTSRRVRKLVLLPLLAFELLKEGEASLALSA